MSFASDIRAYADTAVEQGRQVLDTAQAQLNDYTGPANDLVGKTRENVSGLADKAAQSVAHARRSAEQVVRLDAFGAAVEPYVAQLKEYTGAVSDKVDGFVAAARSDRRVAAVVDRVEPVVGAVVGLTNERVVKPVRSFTGFGATPAPTVGQPGPKPTKSPVTTARRRPAATKPVGKPVTKPVNRPAASRPAAKSATD